MLYSYELKYHDCNANQCDIGLHLKFIYQYFLIVVSSYITEISYYLPMYLHIALYRYISEFSISLFLFLTLQYVSCFLPCISCLVHLH